jgi:histidinol-phosphatase (PHP family)
VNEWVGWPSHTTATAIFHTAESPAVHDYHVHSNYSDGRFLPRMLAAAESAGLDGVGIADHCNVSERSPMPTFKRQYGFNLDITYERRREAIDSLRERYDLDVYDAVEMDYDPREEDAIRAFLDTAGFDYAIGSVHAVEGRNLHDERYFGEKSEAERDAVAERYVEKLLGLIESELFAIAAHPDLIERNPALRGRLSEDHYHDIAAAFADSRTVPELNAGRATEDYGAFHPSEDFLAVLREYDVGVTVGSDAHTPEAVGDQTAALSEAVENRGLDPVVLSV